MIFILTLLFLTQSGAVYAAGDSSTSSFPRLPDTLSFCGERIPLEIADVRERLEEVWYGRLASRDMIALQLKRVGRFFPLFERVLKEHDLPDDLKYLSVAESSLKVEAYSRADAAGLWQFIPSTGRLWGLRVDKQIDERFHVEKSTHAAARLLKNLGESYGSWCLAAAAYNTGQANLNRVIRNQQERDYFDLFLNRETRYYIFQIVVLKELLSNPGRYGIPVDDADYYPPYDDGLRKITLNGPVLDLAHWAKSYGLTYKEIKLKNFWISAYTLPAGKWELLVPIETDIDSTFQDTAITVTNGSDESTERSDPEIYTFNHRVAPSETLSGIAFRYNVELADVREWNAIRGDVLLAGATLLIRLPQGHQINHTVQTRENLTVIARRYSTSIERLMRWNNLASDVITPGQSLTVFVGVL